MPDRINAYLVTGGWWHDFDHARLELLKLLGEHDRVRVKVAQNYEDIEEIAASDFLVSYTCNVRPTEQAQKGLRAWVEGGGRWFALHGTNSAIDPPEEMGKGPFTTPRAFPAFAETLGSQFISHPAIQPYTISVSPGAENDPLVAGVEPFDADDELYLCEYHGELVPLLETHWHGDTGEGAFAEKDWPVDEPRLVMYRRPLGQGEVLYFTLGHCRSTYDMDPPFTGLRWPTIDRGSWELDEFYELLRRGLAWAAGPDGDDERADTDTAGAA